MVKLAFNPKFQTSFSKLKDSLLKERIIKQIQKIKTNPKIGKPMMYDRKGTRELYIKPFRIAYFYIKSKDKVVILEFYHKKKQ